MLVYHGSKNLFDRFDYNKIGENGTLEGKGFYFTDKKHIAGGYAQDGYLYTVEFNGKNPLNFEKKTITKANLSKFIRALQKETDYLSNWGEIDYEGFDSVLKLAVESLHSDNDNDVDIIGDIINASGDVEICNRLVQTILGYDSIVVVPEWGKQSKQTLYIALTNDILNIKKVEKQTEEVDGYR